MRGKIFTVLPNAPEKYDHLVSEVILPWAALIGYFLLAECISKLSVLQCMSLDVCVTICSELDETG